jgi:hypothetical protein
MILVVDVIVFYDGIYVYGLSDFNIEFFEGVYKFEFEPITIVIYFRFLFDLNICLNHFCLIFNIDDLCLSPFIIIL